jgi:ABC-type branched-subunit amino acid transport system substrate-binding protein
VLHIRPPASSSARARGRIASSLDNAQRPDGSHVELWHASLDRFGAEQLNQRFERRFGSAMDSDAWAGWIAMKILAESALRARGQTPSALARALADSKARFDGHKGRSLAFDPTTGVLVQPLYVVARDSTGTEHVVAELPPGVR